MLLAKALNSAKYALNNSTHPLEEAYVLRGRGGGNLLYVSLFLMCEGQPVVSTNFLPLTMNVIMDSELSNVINDITPCYRVRYIVVEGILKIDCARILTFSVIHQRMYLIPIKNL